MNYKSLRKATCCFASALTLAASPMIASASPIAGASDLTSVNVTSELTASSPTSGISLLLSQYLAENTISVNNVAKQSTAATTVTAVESRALVQQEEATDTKEIKEKKEKVMIVAQVEGYVNVRAKANEDSEVLGKLYDDSVGTVIKEKDGWYKIKSGSVTGYVKADYVNSRIDKFIMDQYPRVCILFLLLTVDSLLHDSKRATE